MSQPLDLDAAIKRYQKAMTTPTSNPAQSAALFADSATDVPVLIAEVERLRGVVIELGSRLVSRFNCLEHEGLDQCTLPPDHDGPHSFAARTVEGLRTPAVSHTEETPQ